MRLSDWQSRAPHPDAMTPRVQGPTIEALALLGAGRDPECWVVWGDDPAARYTILALSMAGLVVINCRVNVPGEGPRAGGKIVRWSRLQVGELSVEVQGGHRVITFQIEQQLLHGVDTDAEEIARFVDTVFAAMDGRWTAVSGAIGPPSPVAGGTPSSSIEPPSELKATDF